MKDIPRVLQGLQQNKNILEIAWIRWKESQVICILRWKENALGLFGGVYCTLRSSTGNSAEHWKQVGPFIVRTHLWHCRMSQIGQLPIQQRLDVFS